MVNIKFSSALKLVLYLNLTLEHFESSYISNQVRSALADYLKIDQNRVNVINAEERSPDMRDQIKVEIMLYSNTDYKAMADRTQL